jgi:hypothetical protein
MSPQGTNVNQRAIGGSEPPLGLAALRKIWFQPPNAMHLQSVFTWAWMAIGLMAQPLRS